jgi:hypothetical protein
MKSVASNIRLCFEGDHVYASDGVGADSRAALMKASSLGLYLEAHTKGNKWYRILVKIQGPHQVLRSL